MPSKPLFHRRRLLQGGLALGGLAAFQQRLPLLPVARSAEQNLADHYFIFCYFSGGWDLLMSLDPRDPVEFRDDNRKLTRIQPAFQQLGSSYQRLVETSVDGMTFGPAIGGLARHADKLCVVRGLSMDTLTHEVGRRRFLTGHPPTGLQAKGSSLATLLASYLGADQIMPQLSVLVESYNVDQPSYSSAIRVSSVEDLIRALRPAASSLPEDLQTLADQLLAEASGCATYQSGFHRDALAFRSAAQSLVHQGLDASFDFSAQTDQMAALRDLYGIDPDDMASAAAQAASAVVAVTSGISRCVSIMAAEGLDTHGPEWANDHAPRLRDGFDLMAAMIDDLSTQEYGDTGESWLDRTTILGFSEFGRSPLLNSSGGRDHFLHNACILAGGGIQGGAVVGASSNVGMAPLDVDLNTGQPNEGGQTVRPEHIFRSILQHVGLEDDIAGYGVEALSAIYR